MKFLLVLQGSKSSMIFWNVLLGSLGMCLVSPGLLCSALAWMIVQLFEGPFMPGPLCLSVGPCMSMHLWAQECLSS